MYTCIEKDWQLYRKMIADWQERYINKVNKNIIFILTREGNPSENFWEAYDYMTKSKNNPGVLIKGARKSEFTLLMISLVENKVITKEDIVDFSEELKELLEPYF